MIKAFHPWKTADRKSEGSLSQMRRLCWVLEGEYGVGNGNRTRNRRSHSPVLCQLSYSHRNLVIIAMDCGGRHAPCGKRMLS